MVDSFPLERGVPLLIYSQAVWAKLPVVERVGIERHEVGALAWRECAGIRQVETLRRAAGRRNDHLRRSRPWREAFQASKPAFRAGEGVMARIESRKAIGGG
jgi:hypothetical protein